VASLRPSSGTGGARRRLEELLEAERSHPRPFEEVASELEKLAPEHPLLGRALRALAEADRRRFWVKSEALWFSRIGWRLIRPMMAVGIVAGAAYFFSRDDAAMEWYLHFLFGVAALYIVIQVYAHVWSGQDRRKLDAAEERLRRELDEILAELRR
jgi:hypothetical protein